MVPEPADPVPAPSRQIDLSVCRLSYCDVGSGPAILFVHGIPTNKYLWRNVIRPLSGRFRCLAPDLPGLGETLVRRDGFDYSAPALAHLLFEFLDVMNVETAALVFHDQGGAPGQWMAVERPERFSRLVICNCVCYDNWPVPEVARFFPLARRKSLFHSFCRSPLAPWLAHSRFGLRTGVHDRKALGDDAIRRYYEPLLATHDKREQFRRFILAGDPRWTLEAASRFSRLTMPTLILWARNDRFLPFSWAERLANDIPGAAPPVGIPDCGHFLQEEKPLELAMKIDGFLAATPA